MTVNGEEEIGDKAGEHLHHDAIGGSPRNKMIHVEVSFPPPEEDLDVPAELVGERYLFSGKIMSVEWPLPVVFAVNPVSDPDAGPVFLSY